MISRKKVLETYSLLWISSWFVACWVYHWQLFFTGICFLVLAFGANLCVEKEEKK